jgi:hypothetical protein
MIFFIKVSTIVTHYKRSLALSAPRNIINALVKYLILPGTFTYLLESKRYGNLMANL